MKGTTTRVKRIVLSVIAVIAAIIIATTVSVNHNVTSAQLGQGVAGQTRSNDLREQPVSPVNSPGAADVKQVTAQPTMLVTANDHGRKTGAADSQLATCNYKAHFSQDLFVGDSITEGLSFYEYLDDSNVLARLGLTLVKVRNGLNNLAMAKPRNIYLLFGFNDIVSTTTNQKFIDNYTELINLIKAKYPNSQIYIQSILPVAPQAAFKAPYLNNSQINELNVALKTMARQDGVGYLDIASVLNSGTDLHESDGLHFKANFYPLWLHYLAIHVQ